MKNWDVFISHASEDKTSVALPLADTLRRAGLKVWLDRREIQIGDSLREKIDEGLAASRFGVVVLSKHFLEKGWPKRELNGLMALEEGGQKVILPVWHEITKAELASYSPILADRVAANTDKGIMAVAEAIDSVVSLAPDTPSHLSPTPLRRLKLLIESAVPPERVVEFLQSHPKLLSDNYRKVLLDLPAPNGVIRMAVVGYRATEGIFDIHLIGFANMGGGVLHPNGLLEDDIESQRALLESARVSIIAKPSQLYGQLAQVYPMLEYGFNETLNVGGQVFARRRDTLTKADRKQYERSKGVYLVTYDALLDIASSGG